MKRLSRKLDKYKRKCKDYRLQKDKELEDKNRDLQEKIIEISNKTRELQEGEIKCLELKEKLGEASKKFAA